ncbi:MAG: hypothetical protein AAF368_14700 [Planctomycetota bacterium]
MVRARFVGKEIDWAAARDVPQRPFILVAKSDATELEHQLDQKLYADFTGDFQAAAAQLGARLNKRWWEAYRTVSVRLGFLLIAVVCCALFYFQRQRLEPLRHYGVLKESYLAHFDQGSLEGL